MIKKLIALVLVSIFMVARGKKEEFASVDQQLESKKLPYKVTCIEGVKYYINSHGSFNEISPYVDSNTLTFKRCED